MGYRRSAKKCKEKFENVHKYYKRTKDGRAGRQDGKTYRFFTQLEALHGSGGGGGGNTTTVAAAASATPAPAPVAVSPLQASSGMLGSSGRLQQTPLNSNPQQIGVTTRVAPDHTGGTSAGLAIPPLGVSFSSDTASSSASESEGEDTEEGLPGESRKRKHRGGGGGGSRKMMAFFEGLMKQVMERQEAMQQRFLETIEKREQDRMIREEAWKRQEMARLNRGHEMMAQERAISASRDAAIIAFLQKVTGQTVPVPSTVPAASVTPPPPAPQPAVKQPQPSPAAASAQPPQPPPPPQPPQPPQQPPAQQQTKQHIQHQGTEIVCAQASPVEVGPVAEAPEVVGAASGTGAMDPASSRWPKAEVHALIKIRSGLEFRYQEAGPKGPLWEEIAGQMQRMGYNRSSKRCKEKWENINKYFKKVKESNKRRPEDSKTCPYFHQLDALYRNKKALGAGAAGSMIQTREHLDQLDANSSPAPATLQDRPAHAGLLLLQAPPQHPAATQTEGKDGGGNGNRKGGNPEGNGGSSSLQMQTSNGGFATSFFDEEPGSATAKKPEDIVKGLMDQQQQQHQKQQRRAVMEAYKSLEEPDSDNMDVQEDDEDDDEDDEDSKTAYKIQYQQRPGVNGGSNGGGNQTTSAVAAAAAAGSSFMAMVQ